MAYGTTVLYHGPHCPDGFASSLACWLHYGDDAQYLPVTYGQPPPDIPQSHHVLIVDFSYPAEMLRTLHAVHPSVTVLDHHASAERDLQALAQEHLPGMTVLFDMAESGATLTWKYLEAGGRDWRTDPRSPALEAQMPLFYKLIRDRDLWQWRLPHSKEISLALWTQQRTCADWEQFMADLDTLGGYDDIVAQGTAIRRYSEQLVQEQASRAVLGVIGGYTVPIVNATTLFSEVGDYLCTTQPEIPFAAYYFLRSDGQVQWGLRGHGQVDLSEVAQLYHGGGHHNASGFITTHEELITILEGATHVHTP